jgi:hypothetical protein
MQNGSAVMKTFKSSVCMAIAILISVSCRTPTSTESQVNAIVTPDQFGRAMAAVKDTRSYIPYAEPGTCEARATWLAALFAAEAIPTTKRYVFAPSYNEKLRGPNNVPWNYHVAIMLRANDSQEHMILDPTWGDDWLKVDWQWKALMTSNPAAFQIDVPGSTDGAEVRMDYKTRPSVIVQSFDEMPKFQLETLEKACGTMSIFQTTVSGLDYQFAQKRLKEEMLRIADALQAQNILDWGDLMPGLVYCGKQRLR